MTNTKLFQVLFTALFFCATSLFALDTGVAFAVYSDGESPYVEVNIEIAASSVTFKAVDSTRLQAGVHTLLLIKQGDKIINYEKYILNSPITERPETLLDVKRLALQNGDYTLEITFQDINDSTNTKTVSRPLIVNLNTSPYLSEITLLRSFKPDKTEGNPFTKNGYFLEPLPFNFYDRTSTKMSYYAEIYNIEKVTNEEYTVRSVIEQTVGNGTTKLISVGTQRKKPVTFDAALIQVDISNWESGNYMLTIEIRNKQNELISSRKLEFQRSNPFLAMADAGITEDVVTQQFVQNLDEEKLRYCLQAIAPNAGNDEAESLNLILRGKDLKPMRFFVFNFFVRRNANSPELAYEQYMETAMAADKKFKSGFRYGFETDRGRAYMRFGRPDDLVYVEDDPSAPPYEIWIYYNFPKTNQRNVKFLFYNASLAGDDFTLLHSTARGEINNPRWERVLYGRAGEEYKGDNYHDATQMQQNNNRHARDYFESF